MMAPTYYDRLLGKAGTAANAYDLLKRIGTLSSAGQANRQRVVDTIEAGLHAPWVGPNLPGSTNQHPDADIFGNLARRGLLSQERVEQIAMLEASGGIESVRGIPHGLAMLLAPVLVPDEPVLESESGENVHGSDDWLRAIVTTPRRVLVLSNESQGPDAWIDPVTEISIRSLEWSEIGRVLVQTAAEAPPCGAITVLRAGADSGPAMPPEQTSPAGPVTPFAADDPDVLTFRPGAFDPDPSPFARPIVPPVMLKQEPPLPTFGYPPPGPDPVRSSEPEHAAVAVRGAGLGRVPTVHAVRALESRDGQPGSSGSVTRLGSSWGRAESAAPLPRTGLVQTT